MSEFQKHYTELTIVERLRNELRPKGTSPTVVLNCLGPGMAMHADFVRECIDELEKIPARVALGDKVSSLERLAYQLLLDSAYIDVRHEVERKAKLSGISKN